MTLLRIIVWILMLMRVHLNKNCSKFQAKYFHPYACHTQNGMQEGADSSPQIFNSAIESIMKTI
jgi:hypothetical protein